jgi:DNA-binding MarR family transcriptional regulator
MQANFLHKLLDLAEDYEKNGGNTVEFDMEDFVTWLLTIQRHDVQRTSPKGPITPMNGLIAMYVIIMGRYAEFYTRRIFRDTVIYSMDDWAILVSLFPNGRYKKSDVLRTCVMEKSSGNEVLKRLLRQKLIEESPNPDDHRSKLIRLTDEGREAFLSVDNRIRNLSNLVVADLSEEEKTDLLSHLLKMNRYHQPVFEAADERDLAVRLELSPE